MMLNELFKGYPLITIEQCQKDKPIVKGYLRFENDVMIIMIMMIIVKIIITIINKINMRYNNNNSNLMITLSSVYFVAFLRLIFCFY